jgi:DNA polymerase III subunit epsilon
VHSGGRFLERDDDPPRAELRPEHVRPEHVRSWLRVPRALGLPGWAVARLGSTVACELESRRGRALDDVVFGIVDLETTGLSAERCRILEIGLVALQGTRVLGTWETLVDVCGPVPSGITALTGIHDALLEGAPCEGDALAAVAGFIAEHKVDVLVAHNARFDRGFLQRAWREHGMTPPLPPFLCSVRVARRYVRAPRFGLDMLIEHLAIPVRARHRALGDAEMTADLWLELIARARLAGVHTLEALRKVAEVKTGRAPRARVRVVDLMP